ncbi:hypothetical protein ASE30_18525 [Achromobacter sp. Root83]|nr:hypothetical protein ASE30_18525 [Achromobacter sp. Root83]
MMAYPGLGFPEFTRQIGLGPAGRQFPANEVGNFTECQILALHVLNDLVHVIKIRILKPRHRRKTGDLRGAKAAMTVIDDEISRNGRVRAQRQRRLDAALALALATFERFRKFADALLAVPRITFTTRVPLILMNATDVVHPRLSRLGLCSVQHRGQIAQTCQVQAADITVFSG